MTSPTKPSKLLAPMLAQTGSEDWLSEIEHDRDWAVARKWDGARLIYIINDSGNKLLTRSGRDVIHKFPEFSTRVKELNGTTLDGEGITNSNYLGDVQSILHTKGVERGLQIVLFDCLRFKGIPIVDENGHERRKYLTEAYDILRSKGLKVKLEKIVLKDKRKYYHEVVKAGGEGVMGKDLLAPYTPGKRSYTWLKVKPRNTYEFVILGFTKGTGKYSKLIGAIRYGAMYQGKMTEVGRSSGMTDAEREDMTRNPNRYIGKVAEFDALEITRSGAMRHPSFIKLRPDRNARSVRLEDYL